MPHGFTLPTPTSPAAATCQLDGKHTIASRVRVRLLHTPPAVSEEAQSKMALLRVCGFLWGFYY